MDFMKARVIHSNVHLVYHVIGRKSIHIFRVITVEMDIACLVKTRFSIGFSKAERLS